MHFTSITKRDGRVTDFDASKITAALLKAGKATGEFGEREALRLTMRVLSLARALRLPENPDVETVQDVVEQVLLDSSFRSTAKAYILYREQRAQMRRIRARASVDLLEGYLDKMDWRVRENSNMGFSLQGLNNHLASDVTSEYWLSRIYTPQIRDAHTGGDLHLHDLNLLSVYCVGWDLADLLREGFKGIAGNVESAPPRHFRSALGQLVNFFYTLQGEAAGAQAVSSFDTYLAPFIRHDGLWPREVRQALQEFVFNINIPTRVGFQTPFTNITLDMDVPESLKRTPAIIGGKDMDAAYRDFQAEMDVTPASSPRTAPTRTSPVLHQFHPSAGGLFARHLRRAGSAGRSAGGLHRRHRAARLSGRRSERPPRRARPGAGHHRQLQTAVFHVDPHLQRLPGTRLSEGRAGPLPGLRRGNGGVFAGRGLPAAGKPLERRQTGGIRETQNL